MTSAFDPPTSTQPTPPPETLGIAQDVDQYTRRSEINHDTKLEASLSQEMLVICRALCKLSVVDDEGAWRSRGITRYRPRAHTPPISPDGNFTFYISLLSRQRRQLHNHPSGDPTPSREDIAMTEEIRAAAAMLGIVLHDHIVIGNGEVCSFHRQGLL